MFIRSLVFVLVLTCSFVFAKGQAPAAQKSSVAVTKMRDLPFSNGVDLQFLIKELARDLDVNVLFDPDTFRFGKKAFIDLKNVSGVEALDYIFLQEGLYFEEVGPKTILVANRSKGTSFLPIGAGSTILTDQLAEYFGVEGGILINHVRPNSAASKSGLKAADVIVAIDSIPVKGVMEIVGVINRKKENAFTLTIVRNRKRQTLSLTVEKSVNSVIQKS